MSTRLILLSGVCVLVLAGGSLASRVATPVAPASALSEVTVRSLADAKYQPQTGTPSVQGRQARNENMAQTTAVGRAACPRCTINE